MTSRSIEETSRIAGNFIRQVIAEGSSGGARVVALSGDLGSGKTTFTKEVAAYLNIKETLTSPTFVIEKIYEINTPSFKKFIHIDAYRLESAEELATLGFDNIVVEKENLIFIEWAEKVETLLPKEFIQIRFEAVDETTREITFTYEKRK